MDMCDPRDIASRSIKGVSVAESASSVDNSIRAIRSLRLQAKCIREIQHRGTFEKSYSAPVSASPSTVFPIVSEEIETDEIMTQRFPNVQWSQLFDEIVHRSHNNTVYE